MSPERYRLAVFLILSLLASVSLGYLEYLERQTHKPGKTFEKKTTYGGNLELPSFKPVKKEKKRKTPGYRIALIIDDVGNSREMVYQVARLPKQITPSVLPYREYSLWATLYLKSRGFDVMLHLPMQPQNPELLEKGMLTVDMGKERMKEKLARALRDVPMPVGVNNHEGSLFTSNPKAMSLFLTLLKKKGLFFVDSWTSGSSVGIRLAKKMGLPSIKRDIFLDNMEDPVYITRQWQLALNLARQKGFAVAIAHARWGTMEVLPSLLSRLPRGFSLVRVRSLIEELSSSSSKEAQRIRAGQ